ncbi:putative methyltransferase [Nostoc carneum NIES-2107]|nr:putative methyltransferase [Nostoc carneum NIES-2107]
MCDFKHIESLIKNAEDRASSRTKWPDKLNRFTSYLHPKFKKIILNIFNLLFKDQREVNNNIIVVVKELLAINRQLSKEIVNLKIQKDEQFQHFKDYLDSHIKVIEESYIQKENNFKNDLIQCKSLIIKLLEDKKENTPIFCKNETHPILSNLEQHLLDSFYVAFEDQFRGKREDIKNRLEVYLPFIEEKKVGNLESPILDVGCGRGEWLELLRDSGYTARGLDINTVMVEQSRSRGFEVIEADVMLYLQSLPDSTLGAVTGFHIIEHLTFPILMKFFSEVARTLKPGGIAIFETPNPQNVLVGSCNFYFDPTHHHPLPSALIKFMLEIQGLSQVKVIDLHPYPETYKVSGGELAEKFNNYFYGPQDYAVVGYKL